MKKEQNIRGLKPISYKKYKELREFRYPASLLGKERMVRPTCYKDGNKVKFFGWKGGYDKWEEYAKSLGLKRGVHYIDEISQSSRGPYLATILYVEEPKITLQLKASPIGRSPFANTHILEKTITANSEQEVQQTIDDMIMKFQTHEDYENANWSYSWRIKRKQKGAYTPNYWREV